MIHFITYVEILEGKVPEDFGTAVVKGSSMTIPGQGCDLAQIISSVVKLPPLDERTFDSPAGEDPDLRALAVKTDLESMYTPEGVNFAEDAKARQEARKRAKNEQNDKAKDELAKDDNAE